MVDGVLYASNGIGLVEAFDPETGKTIWVQERSRAISCAAAAVDRGISYWGSRRRRPSADWFADST